MKKMLSAATAACLLLSGCGTAIVGSDSAAVSRTTAAETASAATETTAAETTEAVTAPTQTEAVTTVPSDTDILSDTDTLSDADTLSDTSESSEEEQGILSSPEDIGLYDTDGSGTNYIFTYGGESFSAVYTYENWKIIDSYRITTQADLEIICQALINAHPLHGADGESFRTAEDMAFEWQEHNAAYFMLPEDSEWKLHTKDVDLNPEDQGKTGVEMALDRLREKYGEQEAD